MVLKVRMLARRIAADSLLRSAACRGLDRGVSRLFTVFAGGRGRRVVGGKGVGIRVGAQGVLFFRRAGRGSCCCAFSLI